MLPHFLAGQLQLRILLRYSFDKTLPLFLFFPLWLLLGWLLFLLFLGHVSHLPLILLLRVLSFAFSFLSSRSSSCPSCPCASPPRHGFMRSGIPGPLPLLFFLFFLLFPFFLFFPHGSFLPYLAIRACLKSVLINLWVGLRALKNRYIKAYTS